MRIDAHQHYWKITRGDSGWLTPDAGVLYRDYLPDDLKPLLREEGIDRTILVQAAPTVAETEFLLQLAEEEESIAGVVGWLDMESDDFKRQLEALISHPKFVSIRPMIQDLPDDAWMLRPTVQQSFEVLAQKKFPFDFLTHPKHLPKVLKVLETYPDLACVIDHLSKPDIKNGEIEPWADLMTRVAEHPNVYCKLSGMVTEADLEHWQVEDLAPYVDHVVDRFGVRRVMYGSDWPVCLRAGSYHQVHQALCTLLADRLDRDGEEAVFGGNAARFYRV